MHFIYAPPGRDEDMLKRLATHPKNIDFGDFPTLPPGEMGAYASIVESTPSVRLETTKQQTEGKYASCLIPLGAKGFELKLIKSDSTWKIDTSSRMTFPLEFFFR